MTGGRYDDHGCDGCVSIRRQPCKCWHTNDVPCPAMATPSHLVPGLLCTAPGAYGLPYHSLEKGIARSPAASQGGIQSHLHGQLHRATHAECMPLHSHLASYRHAVPCAHARHRSITTSTETEASGVLLGEPAACGGPAAWSHLHEGAPACRWAQQIA